MLKRLNKKNAKKLIPEVSNKKNTDNEKQNEPVYELNTC